MKNTICKFTKITTTIAMGIALNQAQVAMAGWTGAMNGTGVGKASVNVLGFQGDKPTSVTTTNMLNPSVAMTKTTNYVFGALLPKDASPATVAKVKGSPGYVWDATTIGSNGDSTDNAELESRITITPADCASLDMTSSAVIAPNDKSGTITMTANGTAGTAVWSRGYELPEGSTLPVDLDPENPSDVSAILTFLKANGSLKWDVLLVGPFSLNTSNCTAVTIPFTVETNASKNLYFVTDGVAKSLPLVIECPPDINVTDKQPVTYPPTVLVGGCGNITVTFAPPAPSGGTFPLGFFSVGTSNVTVTATDKDGNQKSCTFNVVVTDTTPPVIAASGTPDDGVLGFNPTANQINAALGTASATDNGTVGNPTPVDSSVTVNGCSRSQTRTWDVTDAAGNLATSVSRTATWTEDATPPVITATGTPANGVLGFNPSSAQIEAALGTATATDICGSVTPSVSTSGVTTNGCSRSQTRMWNAMDAAGNAATQVSRTVTWSVDTEKPVITATGTPPNGVLGFNPSSAQIEAALGTATATDNCGTVTPSVVTSGVTTNGCARSQIRTWNVTDAAGYAANPVSRTVTWTEDKTPPTIPPLPTVTGTCGASVTLPVPTTTDSCGGTVTVSPNMAQTFTTPGTNRVQWTFTDAAGNSSTAYQTGIVAALTFNGFYSPISGTGGSCGTPLRTANLGNNLPVKFDETCGGSHYLTGKPKLTIEKADTSCALTLFAAVDFTLVGNEWHFNWATGSGGVTRGNYKLTVTLQDGSTRFVWIKLK